MDISTSIEQECFYCAQYKQEIRRLDNRVATLESELKEKIELLKVGGSSYHASNGANESSYSTSPSTSNPVTVICQQPELEETLHVLRRNIKDCSFNGHPAGLPLEALQLSNSKVILCEVATTARSKSYAKISESIAKLEERGILGGSKGSRAREERKVMYLRILCRIKGVCVVSDVWQ